MQFHIVTLTLTPNLYRIPVTFTDAQQTIIDTEIAKFLNKRIIKPSEHESGEFISHIFTTPKKDGLHPVIFNSKALNASVTSYHFKMDTLETAIMLMTPGCFRTSIDLKGAYYSVPMALEHQKYLKFCVAEYIIRLYVSPHGAYLQSENIYKNFKTSVGDITS